MIDKLRFKLSATFLHWGIALIPYPAVRDVMRGGLLMGISKLEEAMVDESQ